METKQSVIIRFIQQVLILFACNVLILIILASLVGEGAKSMSSLYQFGSQGLAHSTMIQFLISAVATITLKNFYFSEVIFRKMLALWRTIFLLFSLFIIYLVFIIIFNWFDLDNVYAWAGFILFFGGGSILGSLFMIIKTKFDSNKFNKQLLKYKTHHKEDFDNE